MESIDIKSLYIGVSDYLERSQLPSGNFPGRDFYGKSFAIFLWSSARKTHAENARSSLDALKNEIKGKTFHFEFNRFALSKAGFNLDEIDKILGAEKYVGTRVANWTLLRIWCRCSTGSFIGKLISVAEMLFVRFWFYRKGGVIEDQRGSFSAQYHAFSIALLGELYSLEDPPGCKNCIRKMVLEGAEVIVALTMPSGHCNYLGRGKFQSFGYAAAILALSHAYRLSAEIRFLEAIRKIVSYLRTFQREDGSFPLVLSPSGRAEGDGIDPNQRSLLYAGWYSYNNYYDYLPFMGALLKMADDVLQSSAKISKHMKLGHMPDQNYGTRALGPSILIHKEESYCGVVTLPNRLWDSSQPLPYLEVYGTHPLPSYGGEMMGDGLYSKFEIPLPTFVLDENILDSEVLTCKRSSYRWISDCVMKGAWMGGAHTRTIAWGENRIKVTDVVSFTKAISGNQKLLCSLVRLPLLSDCKQQNGSIFINEYVRVLLPESELVKKDPELFGPDGKLSVYAVKKFIQIGDSCSCSYEFLIGKRQ